MYLWKDLLQLGSKKTATLRLVFKQPFYGNESQSGAGFYFYYTPD